MIASQKILRIRQGIIFLFDITIEPLGPWGSREIKEEIPRRTLAVHFNIQLRTFQ